MTQKIDLKDQVVVNSKGWLWPLADGRGDIEGSGSCWHYMMTHSKVPDGISARCKHHRIAIQAGGNCGFYVKRYAELFDLVYTFEPDPVNFLCLNANVTSSNVIKIQAALGDQHQCIGVNCVTSDIGGTHVSGSGSIPTWLIDDLDLPFCDLIHLDIEGYELYALNGAQKTIQKHQPLIALEYYEPWANRYNTNLQDIEIFLQNMGYAFLEECQGDRIYKHNNYIIGS